MPLCPPTAACPDPMLASHRLPLPPCSSKMPTLAPFARPCVYCPIHVHVGPHTAYLIFGWIYECLLSASRISSGAIKSARASLDLLGHHRP
ncbi:hypothetical protein GUJ93_ZPchr0002g23770 [Zizania palustris]|uniref:Uncharacterized protein n=1 Tax=Zizania palustris TaxID=103762 RepID=A0A8J5STA8_ZIZPA|nr:hypothetical protein GUJ93_ZPchr0002g23770 [Zizania palustris]